MPTSPAVAKFEVTPVDPGLNAVGIGSNCAPDAGIRVHSRHLDQVTFPTGTSPMVLRHG